MSSVKRSLDLIEIIATAAHPPTHADLTRALSIPKSTLSLLLKTLRSSGHVALIGGRYYPGLQLMSLSHRIAHKGNALMSIKPALDRLSRDAGETVLLGVRIREQFMYIEQSPGPSPIRYAVDIGEVRPLTSTAIGRVFLAYEHAAPARSSVAPKAASVAASASAAGTANAKLAATLAKIRHDGYALNEGEYLPDVHAIATPIFGASGEPIAVIAVLGPFNRMADMQQRIWPMLRQTAAQIQADIAGY